MAIYVLYDVDIFGNYLIHSLPRTGVFRVMEEVAYALSVTGECIVTPYATSNLRHLEAAKRYIAANERIRLTMNCRLTLQDKVRSQLEHAYQTQTYDAAPPALGSRLKMKGLYLSDRALQSMNLQRHANAMALRRADIFHNPSISLFPEEIRQRRSPKLFRTVYDVIPLLFPQYCPKDQPETIQAIIDETDEDTWAMCISQSARGDFLERAKGADPAKFFVTSLAADRERFHTVTDAGRIQGAQRKYGIPEDTPYLLSVCSLVPHKNLAHIIRSFVALTQSGEAKDLNLVLAGGQGWHADRFLSEIEGVSESIRSRIIVTGYVDDADLAPLYSGALAFVFMSLYEGFGLPALEAMQCGAPVIASNTSSLPEVVGDAGILLDPTDQEALCQAMIDVYNRPERRDNLSRRSLERAKLFSWERCARETVAVYKRAIGAQELLASRGGSGMRTDS